MGGLCLLGMWEIERRAVGHGGAVGGVPRIGSSGTGRGCGGPQWCWPWGQSLHRSWMSLGAVTERGPEPSGPPTAAPFPPLPPQHIPAGPGQAGASHRPWGAMRQRGGVPGTHLRPGWCCRAPWGGRGSWAESWPTASLSLVLGTAPLFLVPQVLIPGCSPASSSSAHRVGVALAPRGPCSHVHLPAGERGGLL